MIDLHALIDWMTANEKLSGWAQAIGALLALAIAIGIPAWQRRTQTKDARKAELEREVALAQGVFFTLTDAVLWIRDQLSKHQMERQHARTDFIHKDLLSRILMWEERETNGLRVIALFSARNAINRIQIGIAAPFLQHHSVDDKGFSLLYKDLLSTETQRKITKQSLDYALFQRAMLQSWFYKRPFIWWRNRKIWVTTEPNLWSDSEELEWKMPQKK